MMAPRGELRFRRILSGVMAADFQPPFADYVLEVVEAAPHIWVTDEVLHDIMAHQMLGQHGPYGSDRVTVLDASGAWCDRGQECDYPSHPLCFTGWLMRINAVNRKLVYRIGPYDAQINCWEASWPD